MSTDVYTTPTQQSFTEHPRKGPIPYQDSPAGFKFSPTPEQKLKKLQHPLFESSIINNFFKINGKYQK